MKLSEYISGLQKILDKHGDLNCYYASDAEGNSYHRVCWCGTILFVNEESRTLDCVYDEEDLEEYGDDTFFPICVVN